MVPAHVFSPEPADEAGDSSARPTASPAQPGPAAGERGRWAFLLAFTAGLMALLFVRPGGEAATLVVNNVANMVGPLIALWWCLRPGQGHSTGTGRGRAGRASWACLTAATVLLTTGQVLWHGYELLRLVPPFASWVDVLYFLAYPLILAAILLLPGRPLSGLARGRILAETAMTTAALSTFAWYFLVGPIALGHSGSTTQRAVALGYPVCDLVLLFALLFAGARGMSAPVRRVARTLVLAAVLLATGDALFAFEILLGQYRPAQPTHALWTFGYMLIGIAAGNVRGTAAGQSNTVEPANEVPNPGETSRIATVVQYVLVAMVGVLFAYTRSSRGDVRLTAGVEGGAAALTALVLVRQLLESRECSRLYARLREAFGRLDGSHRSLSAANDRLEQANHVLRARDALLRGVAEAAQHLLAEKDLDDGLAAALAAVGRPAGVHRVCVFENIRGPLGTVTGATCRREWCAEGFEPRPADGVLRDLARAKLDRCAEALAAGRPCCGTMASVGEAEPADLESGTVQPVLCVPVTVAGQFWGFIEFEDCQSPRAWVEAEVSILTALAAAVGGALARHQSEAELEHDSLHDGLTGLPNRLLFADRVRQALERARRRADYKFAVLFLDLDRFKVVNDSLGHHVGDRLLVAAADRLSRCVRGNDSITLGGAGEALGMVVQPSADSSVARLGGDEFTILLDDLAEADDAVRVARRILAELGKPFQLDGHEVFTTASIGIVSHGPDGTRYASAEDLLRDADAAMYRAKSGGKARYSVFDASMHREAVARLRLESDLRRAIERDELLLYYQPIICLDTGRLVGFEALVRWMREGRLVSPGDFIPVAEDTGLIVPIGEWVLEQACRQLAAWRTRHPAAAPLSMSVNLSRRQIGDPRLLPLLQRVLEETRIGPASLRLEITESVVMDDADGAGHTLDRIKRIGVELSMDDFGTGYSSLSCLHRFPIDVLKLDRGFLAGSADQRDVAAVVHAIVSLAHNLGLKVVAEGLEKIEQVAFVQALECDFGQGYVFAKPMPAEEAEQFMLSPLALAASA